MNEGEYHTGADMSPQTTFARANGEPVSDVEVPHHDGTEIPRSSSALSEQEREQEQALRLHEARKKAIETWSLRLKIAVCLQIITLIILLVKSYLVSSFGTIGMIICGLPGAFWRKTESVFAYGVLLILNFCKDITILYMYVHEMDAFTMSAAIVDFVILAPIGMYVAFYLYRTLQTRTSRYPREDSEVRPV